MDYVIVEAATASELSKKVNEKIAFGWIPHGNLIVTKYGIHMVYWLYSQAMTKHCTKKDGF